MNLTPHMYTFEGLRIYVSKKISNEGREKKWKETK